MRVADRNGSAECYRRAYLGCTQAIGRNDRDRIPRIAGRLTVIDIIVVQRPKGEFGVACGCVPNAQANAAIWTHRSN